MLRSQKQNAKIASERTKAKQNEKLLSSIVIKNIGIKNQVTDITP